MRGEGVRGVRVRLRVRVRARVRAKVRVRLTSTTSSIIRARRNEALDATDHMFKYVKPTNGNPASSVPLPSHEVGQEGGGGRVGKNTTLAQTRPTPSSGSSNGYIYIYIYPRSSTTVTQVAVPKMMQDNNNTCVVIMYWHWQGTH